MTFFFSLQSKRLKTVSVNCAGTVYFALPLSPSVWSHSVRGITKTPEKSIKRNEKQGRTVFQHNASLFKKIPKGHFSLSICPWPTWEVTQIWSLRFVSGNRPPPYPKCAQWRPCVQTHFQCSDKSSRHSPTPTLPHRVHLVVVNSCFYWAERGVWLRVGSGVLLSLHFLLPSPPSSQGLDAVTPH